MRCLRRRAGRGVRARPPAGPGRVVVLVACLAVTALAGLRGAQPSGAVSQAFHRLAALDGEVLTDVEAPVEIIRDRWGVPHIYATTTRDLFFAQGYAVAQDRLWQLELWRRLGNGTLAELVGGDDAIRRDTFARLLRYRGDMDAEWRSYSPDAREIVTAFVAGINARVAEVRATPQALPVEFWYTQTTPGLWTPEDVISRMAGWPMTRNARTEVQRALLAKVAGVDVVGEVMPPDPAIPLAIPDGLALADLTVDVLALAEGAADPVVWGAPPFALMPGTAAAAVARLGGRATEVRPSELLRRAAQEYGTVGSNNWVVSGARSLTGKPLLANDPHRSIQMPSLRYAVHLHGPGWNVIGAGEPAVPGVAAGHNDRVGFGFTIVGIDQQDLYVEHLHPTDDTQYLDRGTWRAMVIERTVIPVRGGGTREVLLRFTHHGPVLHVDTARRRAVALRWVGQEPGTAGYLASLSLNRARDWTSFREAARRWLVPSENLIYADVDGHIGWVAAGMAPIRDGWSGLFPVPGHEGRYEWQGFLPLERLPQVSDPPDGAIATANQNILPEGYREALGYEWSDPVRKHRIDEVLASRERWDVASFMALQHDEQSPFAQTLMRHLHAQLASATPGDDEDATARALARRLFEGWDGTMAADSAAAALYQRWLVEVQTALRPHAFSTGTLPHAPAALTLPQVVATVERSADARALLAGAPLRRAVAKARDLMGHDPAGWSWGRLHQVHFLHAFSGWAGIGTTFDLPPYPRGGDATTINNTGHGPLQAHGASFRIVLDVADWDRSMMINVPGQSGQPRSAHYGDLLPLWARGEYHPMPFSRAAVEQHAAHRLWLRPAPRMR